MKSGAVVSPSSFSVPNLDRALSILELLRTRPEGLTLSEIARELGLPRNSVFRIANTLLMHEYVERDDETRRLALSQKLFGMAYSSASSATLMESAIGAMRDLRDAVKETTILSVMAGDECLVLEQVPGLHPFRFVCDAGLRQPLNASASPKALLAFMEPGDREKVLRAARFRRWTPATITDKGKYRAHLRKIRERGFALDVGEHMEGVNCIAAPILNRQGLPLAAVTVIGPSFRLAAGALPRVGRIVLAHTERISRHYGHGLVSPLK
ncbi:MAG TPA: IclR family transcriptional regulator [Verrucomicrobiae bacterium]|nr:IclR family transcriptional regulator [Verrucomicrobiae bacterium]